MSTFSLPDAVLLVGAGPATIQDLELAREHTGPIFAVDGGYDHLCAWGVTPDAVLGDMDSICGDVPEDIPTLPIEEQDSTDIEKALRTVSAPLLIGIGFLGGRLDHTLAAMHGLVAVPSARAILIGREDVVFASPLDWRAEVAVGTRISFYPVRRVPAIGSKGLRWPIDDLLFEGGGQIGVSNEASSSRVAAWFAEHGAVTILPRTALGAVIDSLSQ